MTVRSPHVAGYFYPAEKEALFNFLSRSIIPGLKKKPAVAILVPHAGYIYSGETAAKIYAQIELTQTVLILGPNHTGRGTAFSLMKEGVWETPLGRCPIDQNLAGLLLKGPLLSEDLEAHLSEHSIEVQIPFLQYLHSDIQFVPLTIGTRDLDKLRQAGQFIGEVLSELEKRVLVVISSDLNHYEDEKTTREKDQKAISAMLELDETKLAGMVKKYDVSMCGFAPAYVGLVAIKLLGAKSADLMDHTTSALVSGDYDRVVGYAGMIFE